MKKANLILAALLILAVSAGAGAFQIEKSALYVFLHEVKPIEEEAAKALKEEKYALALRKYREALRGYERIWKDYPDLASSRPYGIDQMVDESIEGCKKIIEKIKDKGEAQDAFYLKLSGAVRVDFSDRDIYSVARALTFLTDVNIIVDKTVFTDSNEALSPRVTVRTDEPWPLRTIITRLCQQTGLAYSIEADHVFISTRVKLDEQK